MKLIDKFLKKLNASRNTFATYILTLFTIYFAVDRIVEMLLMIFTGVSVSYWGPIMYTFALACPVFSFAFALQSEFASSKNAKIVLFHVYVIGLYVIAVSMFTQWINTAAWVLFLSVPNYDGIITEFSDLVRPAFTALALYLPLVTVFPLIKKFVFGVDDNIDMSRSIWDAQGINLSKDTTGTGAYSCEMLVCKDRETGKLIKIPENKRFQPMLVCGGSGTGKTSLMFEPMMARDLEKKYFFNEMSKEMGFAALKTGFATLNCPYGNDYINENFNLGMISPKEGKENVYKAYMKKLLLPDPTALVYRNAGITFISPDIESITHMIDVSNNFKIKYNLIDPSSSESIGLNPFIYDNPSKIAVLISSVLRGMYNDKHDEEDDLYKEDVAIQAIENLTILLKEMYPRMNEGALPNLEDLLKLLTNFDLVEKMCKILESDEELAEKYAIQLVYLKRSFFKGGSAREDTEKYVLASVTQLDNLLRLPGVKNVLCNRYNNLDFDKMLANAEVTFVCTRRGDLGATSYKAFGLFFLLSMQNAVLSRPGNENNRVPNFLYIDEFPDFICKATEAIFTMYRKYRVGTIISTQSLSQLGETDSKKNYRGVILANCAHKVLTGGTTPEEAEWWNKEINERRKWKYTNSMDTDKLEYEHKMGNVSYEFEDYMKPGKIMGLAFKNCAYKITGNGRPMFGEGVLNFMEAKYKEPHSVKTYNFSKFVTGNVTSNDPDNGEGGDGGERKKKFDFKHVDFEEGKEANPVQTDTTDLDYLFDNEDAITVKWKK